MLRKGIICLLVLVFIACNNEDDEPVTTEEQHLEDVALIDEYIIEEGLDAQSTPSDLHYVIYELGETPGQDDDTVNAQYVGYFLNGEVFDNQSDEPITFNLGSTIQGWQEGIPLIGKGGEGTLLVPSRLAYGPAGTRGIPPNSVILFDVTVNDMY